MHLERNTWSSFHARNDQIGLSVNQEFFHIVEPFGKIRLYRVMAPMIDCNILQKIKMTLLRSTIDTCNSKMESPLEVVNKLTAKEGMAAGNNSHRLLKWS